MKNKHLTILLVVCFSAASAVLYDCRCDAAGCRSNSMVARPEAVKCHHDDSPASKPNECSCKCQIEKAVVLIKGAITSGNSVVRDISFRPDFKGRGLYDLKSAHFQLSDFNRPVPDYLTQCVLGTVLAFRAPPQA